MKHRRDLPTLAPSKPVIFKQTNQQQCVRRGGTLLIVIKVHVNDVALDAQPLQSVRPILQSRDRIVAAIAAEAPTALDVLEAPICTEHTAVRRSEAGPHSLGVAAATCGHGTEQSRAMCPILRKSRNETTPIRSMAADKNALNGTAIRISAATICQI